MKVNSLLILFLAMAMYSCDSYVSSSSTSYEETKLSLGDQEKHSPTEFLENSGTYRKNLLGQWVLEGAVSSKATVATYKDVVLGIEFVSQTGTVISTTEKTLYEVVGPNVTKSYKLKINGPEGTSEIRMGVISAVPN